MKDEKIQYDIQIIDAVSKLSRILNLDLAVADSDVVILFDPEIRCRHRNVVIRLGDIDPRILITSGFNEREDWLIRGILSETLVTTSIGYVDVDDDEDEHEEHDGEFH